MAVLTPYFHIELNDKGVPIISGTTMKVVELVQEHLANDWGPDQLVEQHPYLSKGQVYSTLAYYWDHKEELDRDIERRRALAEEYRRRTPEPPILQHLRDLKASK